MLIPNGVKTKLTRTLGRALLTTKKFSPEILTGVGVVGVVAGAVMASRATLKLEETLAKTEKRIDTVKALVGEEDPTYKRELAKVYVKGGVDITKLYGPSVSLELASLVCIISAHGIMRKRNVALVAAYKAVETSFSEYRKRVIEEFGADKDEEYRTGVYEVEVVNEKTGKKSMEKVQGTGVSQYARFFDEFSTQWDKNPEYNLNFLHAQQNFHNDMLKSRGYVFLNDVYEALGLERSQAGQVVGWYLNGEGDDMIDFGLTDPNSESARRFVNGLEAAVHLDFNVQGLIYDKLKG